MKCVPFQSPSTLTPRREFCGVKRNSEFWAFTVLLKGTLPKFEPRLEPSFLSHQTEVRSIKPIGMTQVLPSRMKVGDVFSRSHGLEPPESGPCGARFANG